MRNLLEYQVLFFQQITPWIDVKIRALESQAEEQSFSNERRLQELWFRLNREGSLHQVPMELQGLTRLQVEVQELKNFCDKLNAAPQQNPSENVSADPPAINFPIAHAFRYYIFEEVFRGESKRLIEHLKRYVPYFMVGPEPVLDLGCGRGEFLELMKEIGKDAYGVEMNQYEVEQIAEKGLKVVRQDMLTHLQQLQPRSIGSVFCAQVVEHITPEQVYQMLSRLHVVMRPGAFLLIETVNPISVFGFHNVYFKDPTHIFPVHPETLAFMMKYAGFQRVEIHPITPVPLNEKLATPTSMENSEIKTFLDDLVHRLNGILYSDLEYYAIGYTV